MPAERQTCATRNRDGRFRGLSTYNNQSNCNRKVLNFFQPSSHSLILSCSSFHDFHSFFHVWSLAIISQFNAISNSGRPSNLLHSRQSPRSGVKWQTKQSRFLRLERKLTCRRSQDIQSDEFGPSFFYLINAQNVTSTLKIWCGIFMTVINRIQMLFKCNRSLMKGPDKFVRSGGCNFSSNTKLFRGGIGNGIGWKAMEFVRGKVRVYRNRNEDPLIKIRD